MEGPRQAYNCTQCGTEFQRYPCQARGKHGVFCSKDCLAEFRRAGHRANCAMCDGEFYRSRAERLKNREGAPEYCSRACYDEWRAMHRKRTTYMKTGTRHTHRVVAAATLGRELDLGEIVHHLDNDFQNNDPRNLAVFPSNREHALCHAGSMGIEELRTFALFPEHVTERHLLCNLRSGKRRKVV